MGCSLRIEVVSPLLKHPFYITERNKYVLRSGNTCLGRGKTVLVLYLHVIVEKWGNVLPNSTYFSN